MRNLFFQIILPRTIVVAAFFVTSLFLSPALGMNPEGDNGDVSKAELLKKLEMEIVYLFDMTKEMSPYIEAASKAVHEIGKDPEVGESIRFGLWGYRDSMDIPGMEFNTRNFTPRLLAIQEFEKVFAEVAKKQKDFITDSGDYPEDVFSGIDKAMKETQWTENALHIIVLVGDAPSHEPGHKWNYSGASAKTLRTFADDNKFSIFSLHIKEPKAKDYWDIAEEQFQTLSKNKGVNDASYWSVQSTDMNGFAKASQTVTGELVNMVKAAKKNQLNVVASAKLQRASSKSDRADIDPVIQIPFFVGRTDESLKTPQLMILLTKKQLESVKELLHILISAGRRGMISGEGFFDNLQSIPSVAARGDHIKYANCLADSGLIPKFMHDLPYKSRIMSLSNELWACWSWDQKEEFLNEIDTKIKLYDAIYDNPKAWMPKGDDSDEYVCAIRLEVLP